MFQLLSVWWWTNCWASLLLQLLSWGHHYHAVPPPPPPRTVNHTVNLRNCKHVKNQTSVFFLQTTPLWSAWLWVFSKRFPTIYNWLILLTDLDGSWGRRQTDIRPFRITVWTRPSIQGFLHLPSLPFSTIKFLISLLWCDTRMSTPGTAPALACLALYPPVSCAAWLWLGLGWLCLLVQCSAGAGHWRL